MNDTDCSQNAVMRDTHDLVAGRVENSTCPAGSFLLRKADYLNKTSEPLLGTEQLHGLYARSQILLGNSIPFGEVKESTDNRLTI